MWYKHRHGASPASPGGREPAHAARHPGRRPGDGGRVGCAAADRASGGLAASAGAAGGRPRRGPPGRAAARLQPARAAARRGRRLAGPVPGPLGAAPGCPAHRGGPGKTRTKEHGMTADASRSARILGSLRSVDGKGVVRMEDRFDTDPADLWSALTDPRRPPGGISEVEGALRLGGEFRARFFASGWNGTGRVEACEPPRRLRVLTRDPD